MKGICGVLVTKQRFINGILRREGASRRLRMRVVSIRLRLLLARTGYCWQLAAKWALWTSLISVLTHNWLKTNHSKLLDTWRQRSQTCNSTRLPKCLSIALNGKRTLLRLRIFLLIQLSRTSLITVLQEFWSMPFARGSLTMEGSWLWAMIKAKPICFSSATSLLEN